MLTNSTVATNNISALSPEPNDIGGLTDTQLQALFDKFGVDFQVWFNATHLAELASTIAGSSGAENIGSATISGLTGNTIYAQIASLLSIAQSAQAGSIVAGTITDTMLSSAIGQIKDRLTSISSQSAGKGASMVGVQDAAGYFTGTNQEDVNAELFTFANSGKTAIANAVNAKGISATGADTFSVLASKISTASLVNTADANAVSSQILDGLYAYVNGSKIRGMIPILTGDSVALASSVSGTTFKLRPPTGYKNGTSDNVTITDANFVAGNILSGKTVHGLAGSAINGAGMKRYAYGTGTGGYTITVSGLAFIPNTVLISNNTSGKTLIVTQEYGPTYTWTIGTTTWASDAVLTSGGFTANIGDAPAGYQYWAWE